MNAIPARIAAAIIAVLLLASPHVQAVAQSTEPSDVYGHIDDDHDEVVIDGVVNMGNSASHDDGTTSTVVTEVVLAPACEGNHPDNEMAYSLCVGAQTSCPPTADGDPQILMWRWTRQWDAATDTALTDWEMQSPICLSWDETEVPNIPLLVMREFEERAKLLEARLHVQPPRGRTLVNFDTIFYAEDPSTTFNNIQIAGSSVDLQISADSYTWHFGDGATMTTDEPGRPYPDKDVTHRYTSTETYGARVDVTYSGRYRINDGAWLDIAGTATVTGPEAELTVVAARSELIAG